MQFEGPSKCVRWPILRVHAGATSIVSLLSGQFLLLNTHFAGHTVLCPMTDECHLCALLPARSHWYLPAVSQALHRPCLLELSATSAADLEQRAKFSGLAVTYGLRVELSRRKAKSPLRCDVLGMAETPEVARPDEWLTPLFAIFGLPPLTPGESVEKYSARVRAKCVDRTEVAAARVRAAACR